MCGIVGIFDTRGRRPVDQRVLARMNDSQRHRGPDDDGFHVEPGTGLGFRRLSIIDLATGHQPLYNEDGSVAVIFNGEIYNYQSLVAELLALGHVFRTRSDTEVIVHAWESWGAACVERFRGMFAFAIWDRAQETLFLARDRLGVKPLYYAMLPDGHLIFGSELKSLLAHGAMSRELDARSVEDYFALGYVPEPRTIFAAAAKLPPAHVLVVKRGSASAAPRAYWDVRFSGDNRMSDADACAELRDRLTECVKLRMIADVPLGAFLSGGVDSSAVVATMARLTSEPVNTCAIGFADPRFDESEHAALVAARYGTRHFTETITGDDFGLVDRLAGIYDEPFADSSALPTFNVCRLARRQVTVALSGDGGDEQFGGYRRYRSHLGDGRLRAAVAHSVRRPLFGLLGSVYPEAAWAPRIFRAKSTLQALARDEVEAYFHEVSVLRGPLRQALFSASLRRQLDGYNALEVFRGHAANAVGSDPLALIQYLDLKTYLVGDINTKVDRASMANSLEVREPLMDHVLVEWLATLPAHLKIRGTEGKYLLKKAMEPDLPASILYRRKQGFAAPLAQWFRGPLRQRITAVIAGERLASTGFFNDRVLRRMLEQHLSGDRDQSAALWSLMMFDGFLANVGYESAATRKLEVAG